MIQLRYFASLRDTLGKDREEIHFQSEFQCVADIKQYLISTHPQWALLFSQQSLLSAVNHQMARDDTPLKDGDEIAFFPPVTGG